MENLTLADISRDIAQHQCNFESCNTCTNFVAGEGDPNADLMLVGEAPGAHEDLSGRPFVGRAGKFLDQLLSVAEIQRKAATPRSEAASLFITNVLKARPPGNRDPTPTEIEHNLPWLQAQLDVVSPRIIVTLGRIALECFVPYIKISECHGMLISWREYKICPWYHPAAGLRNTAISDAMYKDASLLKHYI